MGSIRASLLALAALGCSSAIVLAVLFIAYNQTRPEIWISAMGAIVAVMALGNAVLVFVMADQRTGFSNAFAIARRWEEEPVRSAREILRPHVANIDKLPSAVKKDEEVKKAIIHVTNFYWDLASAVETGWTQSGYLRLRFKTSLDTLYPAIETFANNTHDKSASDALSSIAKLRDLWRSRPAP